MYNNVLIYEKNTENIFLTKKKSAIFYFWYKSLIFLVQKINEMDCKMPGCEIDWQKIDLFVLECEVIKV